jgi:hypothetical protein
VRSLSIAVIALNFTYPAVLTGLQWYSWSESAVGRALLSLPLDPKVPLPALLQPARIFFEHAGGYFAFYAIDRFWLSFVLTCICAAIFQFVFVIVRRIGADTEPRSDNALPLLAVLIVGWPGVVVFVPLSLCFAVVHGVARAIQGRRETSFGPSLSLAAFVVAISGPFLVAILHLTVLIP